MNVEFDGIAPVEASFTEMLFRLCNSCGIEKTVDTEVVEGIEAEIIFQFSDRHSGSDQFALCGKINAVVAGKTMGWTSHPHVHLLDYQFSQGLDAGSCSCPPYY